MKDLQNRGHQVSMVTSNVSPYFIDLKNKNGKKLYNESILISGIPVYVLHSTLPQIGVYCSNASNLAKEIIKKYDLIHIRNWYDHLSIVFYKAAQKYRIPFVFTSHGTLDPVARNKYNKRIKKIIDLIYTKKMLKECGAIQASTDSEITEFKKMGAEQQKIFRINMSVPVKDFQIKKRNDIVDRLKLKKSSYLLFLGRIHEKKGLELLLESFSNVSNKFKDLSLVIAGEGSESYERKIKQMVQDLGLEQSVKFSGMVMGDEKLQLLESAKIFVLTTYSDVHPMAVVEALAMGVPVLITKHADFHEIEEYNAGKIVDVDIESITDALEEMLENTNKLKLYSENGKNLFLEKFEFKEETKKNELMYNYAIKSVKERN